MPAIPDLIDSYRHGWTLPFRGEIYEDAVESDLQNGYGIKGQFSVARSKYLIKPFQSVRNPRKRTTVILKAVQTGGSLIADLAMLYRIKHNPGDTLWLFQDDEFASTYIKGRIIPLIKNTPSLQGLIESSGRHAISSKEFRFPHMLTMIGGLNEGNVQSFSWRYVTIDEAWLGKSNGLIRQAKARTRAYPYTSHVLIVSQAGNEDEDLDLEWKATNMQEWAWLCPSCKKHQVFEWTIRRENDPSWAGMHWDTNEITRPNGRWNYPAVARTARLECLHCGAQVDDTPSKRRLMDDTHEYIVTNPAADESLDGFHWPAIANADISFGSLVTAYLQAKEQQELFGYTLPLQEFYQKNLARAWSLNQASDIHRVSYEPYDISKEWPAEEYRFMEVDCQKDFLEMWAVVRAWSKTESRQLARRRCDNWDQVAKLQEEFKVKDQRVFVDAGYEQTQVAQECVKHGHIGVINGVRVWLCWNALKGSDTDTFKHTDPKTKVVTRKYYSEVGYLDPNSGAGRSQYKCPFYSWSNLNVKDILRRLRDGSGMKFLSLPDTDPPTDQWSYTAQMNSEMRVKEIDPKTGKRRSIWKQINAKRPNHYWDCEAMGIVPAMMCGIIGGDAERTEEDEQQAA